MDRTMIPGARRTPFLALTAAALALFGAALAWNGGTPSAAAIAPCVAHQPSAEELELLALVNGWRGANLGAPAATASAPLNAAAKGYAEYLAADRSRSGHFADGSTPWGRAKNCGYTSVGSQAAGGEALGRGSTPGDALGFMVQVLQNEPGAGLSTPGAISGYPVICAGVAKATGPAGTVWIVMLMARSGPCPETVGSEPTPVFPTATPTATPTSLFPTATPTATPTSLFPTATPTRPPATPTATATATPTASPTPALPTPTPNPYPWRLTAPQAARD